MRTVPPPLSLLLLLLLPPHFLSGCRTLPVGHEFGRADGNVAHHAGGPGVPQEEHLGPGVFPPEFAAGWGGAVPAAGAASTRDGGQSEWARVAGGVGGKKV